MAVEIKPKVVDRLKDKRRRILRTRCCSAGSEILPSYMPRAPKVTEVLPILYLRGLSTGDFQAAVPVLLGEDAGGLSPTTVTRLTASWETEYHAWRTRSLADTDYVCVWVDGVHFRVRLEEDRLCTESWATVLRDLKRRGLRAPVEDRYWSGEGERRLI